MSDEELAKNVKIMYSHLVPGSYSNAFTIYPTTSPAALSAFSEVVKHKNGQAVINTIRNLNNCAKGKKALGAIINIPVLDLRRIAGNVKG